MDKKGVPLVSVIAITFNSEKYINETLDSIAAQTYENIELIISDDGSIDRTVSLCQKWISRNKKRFIHTELIAANENLGISANCNRGIRIAHGEWIKINAGDDVFLK